MAIGRLGHRGAWLIALGAATACAAEQAERFFERHDRDRDGKLSREEFPQRAIRLFDRIDANRDGFITLEEDKAFRRTRRQRPDRGNRMNRPLRPEPSFADVRYGAHGRNVLDFWRATSKAPAPVLVFFHGGGFRAGDKRGVNPQLLESCLASGISFAAANYRLSGQAPYPAQMHDSARAIQFLRSKAKAWGVDPKRIAAYGGSAGAGISFWLAFHDDLADPAGDDPVARQSTRLTCAAGLQAQSTYDPREIRKIVPGRAYNDGALKQLFALPRDWDWDTADIDAALSEKLRDASPVTHLTKDDPPVFVFHRKEQDVDGNIHHANFGRYLKKRMDALGIECVHRMSTDYADRQGPFADVFAFVARQFGVRPAQGPAPGRPGKHVYKKVGARELALHTDYPDDWRAGDKRPAIVFFFGGGWTSGSAGQFQPQAEYFARRGLVCARADYRVRSRDSVRPSDCVEDAIDAMRWVRAHAAELGVDPNRIVSSGGSAGGHLAACTFFSKPAEALPVSPKPNAMILYNPALDLLAFKDSAHSKFTTGLDDATLLNISPLRHVRKNMPPTLVLDGTRDFLYDQNRAFVDKGEKVGAPVEVYWAEGATHGFFNTSPWLEKTTQRADEFLQSIGYLKSEPKVKPPSKSPGPKKRRRRRPTEGT